METEGNHDNHNSTMNKIMMPCTNYNARGNNNYKESVHTMSYMSTPTEDNVF